MAEIIGVAVTRYFKFIVHIMKTHKCVKRTTVGIAKQAGWPLVLTVVGGLLGGPFGALAGAAVGAGIGYRMADEYDSLPILLRKMDEDEKKELVIQVQQLVGSKDSKALKKFISNRENNEKLAELIQSYLAQTKTKDVHELPAESNSG